MFENTLITRKEDFMITLAVDSMSTVRSRFTPLPLNMHLWFCVYATVVFMIIFYRRKSVSSLIWALICDATLILQFYNDKYTAAAVFVCEVVMFAILAVLWVRDKKAAKLKAAAEESSEQPDESEKEDNLEDIAKLVKTERDRLDNGGSIIDNAFEDDGL